MLALANREVVRGLIHDDNAILEFDGAADFHRLPFATREALDFIINRNIVAQSDLTDDLGRHVAHHTEIEEWDAEDMLDRLAPEIEVAGDRQVVAETHRLLDGLNAEVNG